MTLQSAEKKSLSKSLVTTLIAALLVLVPTNQESSTATVVTCASFGISGQGTPEVPFLISTSANLYSISACIESNNLRDRTFLLTQNIDLSSVSNQTPIPGFSGTLNGGGHSITGISISSSGAVTGLFQFLTHHATFSNLAVSGKVDISNSAQVMTIGLLGGMALDGASLQNVTLSGQISAIGTTRVVGVGLAFGQVNQVNQTFLVRNVAIRNSELIAAQGIGGLAGIARSTDINGVSIEGLSMKHQAGSGQTGWNGGLFGFLGNNAQANIATISNVVVNGFFSTDPNSRTHGALVGEFGGALLNATNITVHNSRISGVSGNAALIGAAPSGIPSLRFNGIQISSTSIVVAGWGSAGSLVAWMPNGNVHATNVNITDLRISSGSMAVGGLAPYAVSGGLIGIKQNGNVVLENIVMSNSTVERDGMVAGLVGSIWSGSATLKNVSMSSVTTNKSGNVFPIAANSTLVANLGNGKLIGENLALANNVILGSATHNGSVGGFIKHGVSISDLAISGARHSVTSASSLVVGESHGGLNLMRVQIRDSELNVGTGPSGTLGGFVSNASTNSQVTLQRVVISNVSLSPSTSTRVGGLFGQISSSVQIKESFFAISSSGVPLLVGQLDSSNSSFTSSNSFARLGSGATEFGTAADGALPPRQTSELTEIQLQSSGNFSGWDFVNVWGYNCAVGAFPMLRSVTTNLSTTCVVAPLQTPAAPAPSGAAVAASPRPQAPAYAGPMPSSFSQTQIAQGATLQMFGTRLGDITGIYLDGIRLTTVHKNISTVEFMIPMEVSPGFKNLLILSSAGSLTFQQAFEVSRALASPSTVSSSTSSAAVGPVTSSAAVDSATRSQRLTIVTLKNFTGVYARGFEGSEISIRIAGRWLKVESATSFVRLGRFTRPGLAAKVLVYVDKALIGSSSVRTR